VGALLDDERRLEPGLNRSYIPRHKKGGSVSHFAIAGDGPALLALYRSARFRRFLARLVRADLHLCPDEDPHACALYFYTEAGDHMGYHYDTSYYKGARYTVLLGRAGCSAGCTPASPGARPSRRRSPPIRARWWSSTGTRSTTGSARPARASGAWRVVFTMEYVTSREMGRARRPFSNLKDAFAYFGLRALWRSRARGTRVTA
jgi:hypothetical protein